MTPQVIFCSSTSAVQATLKMFARRAVLLLVWAAVAHAAPTMEDEVESVDAKATERFTNITSLSLPTDFSSSSLIQFLISGGSIVLALVGLVSVIALVMPLFGFKQLCYLLGTCSDPNSSNAGYLAGGGLANGLAQAYDAYHTYNQPASAYNASPSYQRRSLSYFGPILKALNTAYEKYEGLALTPVKKE